MIRLIGRCLLLIILVTACSGPNTFESISEKDYSLNKLELGLSYVPDSNVEYQSNTLEHLKALNINRVRVGYSWDLREASKDFYDMESMDKRFTFYEDNNIDVLLTIDLKAFPKWLEDLEEDEFIKEFEEIINLTLERYGDNIATIQLGNEWDWEIEKYFNNNVDLFIQMNNILFDKVKESDYKHLDVAISSISIGGVRALAFKQARIKNVTFKKGDLYTEAELLDFSDRIATTNEIGQKLYQTCKYDLLDIHLYDDYWNWSHYVDAIYQTSERDKQSTALIVSEFGGPDPKMEPQEDDYRAVQLYYYIQSLDGLNIDYAYYFKLHENTGAEPVYHPFSYLIDKDNNITDTYKVILRYGQEK